jgi:hypothetical protein
MDVRTVELYLAQAAAATSVRELHAAVRTLRHAHPADPDADRIERACWDAALGLLTRSTTARPAARPAARSPAVRSPASLRPAERPAADWKERAARMEPA